MSFAWLDYLMLAEALLQARTTLAPEEACCRAASSRAYYAVYGAARTRARDQEGLQLPATGDAHQLVITHYRQGRARCTGRLGTPCAGCGAPATAPTMTTSSTDRWRWRSLPCGARGKSWRSSRRWRHRRPPPMTRARPRALSPRRSAEAGASRL